VDVDPLEKRLAALKDFFPLEESNVKSFLNEVADVTSDGDPRAVGPVLLLADDDCPLGSVMSRMLSLLEDVPLAAYVEELIAVLPEFAASSPRSAEDEVKKLLWSDADRSVLVSAASRAGSEQRSALRRVLEDVDTEGLAAPVKEILTALDAASS
jgi:hypothetical protein